jgi:TonB family protein
VIFCQACGSQNAPDARFCNMCGAPIAKVGTPGGPIEHTQLGVGLTPDTSSHASTNANAGTTSSSPGYYPGGGNTMSVQLDAIGIRSTKKTWATLGGIALLVFALGGVATFFTMRSAHEDTGGAAEEDPFEVGSPQIEGADEVDFVSGRRDGQGMPTPPSPTTPSGTTPPSTTEMGTTPSTTTPTVATNTTMSQTSTNPSTMTTPTTMETTPTTMETTPVTMEEPPTTMETTPTDTPPEGEMEMEMYASRVRYLVRRYYLPRSQSCFEHATRNNPSLHGQVMVSLTIGATGTVTSSSVARNSTGDTGLGSCLATQVRSWQLTPPPGGEPITMTLPFSR